MDIGDGLVYLALVTMMVALMVYIISIKTPKLRPWGIVISAISLLFTLCVWMLMTRYFLDVNLNIEYVHEHTSAEVPEAFRISGVWAGKVGSFLLWVVGMQVGLLAATIRFGRRANSREAKRLLDLTTIIGSVMVLVFLVALVMVRPFQATNDLALSQFPDGLGMNVLLQHPLMALHPLLALIGYGIATVPFVSSVAFLLTGNRHWASYSLPFSRLFFLIFTIALLLGGLWAYSTLGWGGYWAWDPVETSSLLPWLIGAVVCHTQVTYVKRRRSKLLGATVSYFLLPVILFATFSARSGLWQSVHAYAATEGDFWDVISSSGFLLGLFVITIALSLLGPVLLARAYVQYYEEGPRSGRIDAVRFLMKRPNALLFGNILILMSLMIIIFIMMNRVGGPLDPGEFEVKLAPLALVLAAGMMLFHFGTRRAKVLPFAALAIGVAGGLVTAGLVPESPLTAFSVPFLTVGVVGTVYYIWRSPKPAQRRRRVHKAGASIIHLGVLLMLMGYASSTFLTHEDHVNLSEGTPVEFDEYQLVLVDKEETNDSIFLTIEVHKDGRLIGVAEPGKRIIQGQYRAEVSIVRLLDKDLYFVMEKEIETGAGLRAEVVVKSLPAINLLWGGAFMVAAGTGLRFVPYEKLERIGCNVVHDMTDGEE